MHRPLLAVLAALALGACVPLSARRSPPPLAEVADDGKTVRVAGESWAAQEGLSFFLRGRQLHVISVVPGQPFDVAIELLPGAPLSFPQSAPFVARDHRLQLATPSVTPAFAELLATGQLHLHEEHAHLTHRFRDPDWQALYALRAEGSAVEPLRRRVAALLLAELLEAKLPAGGGELSERGLRRIVETIGRVRRGFEAGLAAGQLEGIVEHGYEIRDGGALLAIGASSFRTSPELRFAYCTGHFHVEDAQDRWAQIVTPPALEPGAPFVFPPSMLFEVSGDGLVSPRQGPGRARELLESGQLRYTHGHVHVTERYGSPALARLLAATEDPALAEAARAQARAGILELLRMRFELGTGEELEAQLGEVDRLLAAVVARLDEPVPRREQPARGGARGR